MESQITWCLSVVVLLMLLGMGFSLWQHQQQKTVASGRQLYIVTGLMLAMVALSYAVRAYFTWGLIGMHEAVLIFATLGIALFGAFCYLRLQHALRPQLE